ncbi:arsenite methyltransferase [Rhodothermus marinus]|uniref:Arsenite methyltransferase n=1 Tax=Rhodothermus marinus (strain ATCC 43812 / DSM 4252 / R-10) TaxID=518766 RepID=D0MFW1_RHOM4|nr:arsenite methyltransferase [Rhodothermus marinus]ACY49450.1 Methyltransferase type 11 [Rhodothermus marinus DSM 4252]
MTTRNPKEIVRQHYAQVARKQTSCCTDACGCEANYSEAALAELPEGARLGLGCGNPLALAEWTALRGATVLDLGAGAGRDCLLAARQVGPEGRVIGIDLTPEMVALARENARKMGVTNVIFREGDITALPLPDASVDVVLSNCAINLVPDKARAFVEAFRVLRPGGLLLVADLVRQGELPEAWRDDPEAYARCLTGTIPEADYLAAIEAAGFVVEYVERSVGTGPVVSLQVRARRSP